MTKRHTIHFPPEDVYPIDEWKIVQKKFSEKFLAQDETVFASSNGYLGMRGNLEEGKPSFQKGTFINRFYETWPIPYGEKAFGFAKRGQTMVNVPDCQIIKLYVDDEPFLLSVAHLKKYERVLNMKEGIISRDLIWETPSGKQILIQSKRVISMEHRHLALFTFNVTVLNARANIIISSKIVNSAIPHDNGGPEVEIEDPRKASLFGDHVFDFEQYREKDYRLVCGYRTKKSKMTLSCGIDHEFETENMFQYKTNRSDQEIKVVFNIAAEQNKPIQLIKYVSYHSSRSADPNDLCDRVERTIDRSKTVGPEQIFESQRKIMADFWSRSDVQIKGGHPRTQQAMRFNLYHVWQAAARAEGTGVGARGLTGTAYDGHYFWDTEIYVLPFLTYTSPLIARNLIKFRHSLLDKARERARQVNQKGALYPWRTISGEEASAFFAAGTAQYHINADIMYAMKKYVNATGDVDFLFEYGIEMLIETARLWVDLGSYPEGKKGQFHLHSVTGPDEYTALVNNNLYTNMMARENLRYAIETIEAMQQKYPDRLETVLRETRLEPTEVDDWRHAAENMYIPYDEKRKIHPQDDEFLNHEVWDFANTPEDHYPLLLYYHPLVIYRHQVIKQADLVMAMFLLGDNFTKDEKEANFNYYEPLTTGDSSLSACIHGVLASELGLSEKAEKYFNETIFMDFGNVSGNVQDGAHIASMAGAWLNIVYGFAGMRDSNGTISFYPRLNEKIQEIKFCLTVKGQMIDIAMSQAQTCYSLRSGDGLSIKHKGKEVVLKEKSPVTIPN